MGNSSTKHTDKTINNNNNNNNNNINVISSGTQESEYYLPVFKSSKAELVNYLLTSQPKYFNQYLLYLKSRLYNESIRIQEYISEMEYAFYLSTDIDKSLEYFASLSKQLACSKIWGPKAMFYRCKTCALSPNSSICYDCFKKGPHEKENHDYLTSFGSFGGSCDCGARDSWKPSGFCSDHSSQDSDIIPSSTFKPEHLLSTHLVIRNLLLIIMEFPIMFPIKKNIYNHIVAAIFDWLIKVTDQNRAISHVLGEELCYQSLSETSLSALDEDRLLVFSSKSEEQEGSAFPLPLKFQPPIETILLTENQTLQDKYGFLFLYLLCEYRFKFGFAQTYIKVYSRLCKADNVDLLFKTSPQLFSVAPISEIYTIHVKYGFIQSIFDALFSSFETLKPGSPFDKNHVAITCDIKSIIQHPQICKFILIERLDLLELFFRLFKRVDQLDTHIRARKEHVQLESDEWATFFQMNLECKEICTILIDALEVTHPLEKLRAVVSLALGYISTPKNYNKSTMYLGTPVTTTDLFDAQKEVTLLLPMHRFVGIFLHKVLQLHPETNVSDYLPVDFDTIGFMYPIILCHMLVQQVSAGYWVRNGDVVMRKRIHIYALFFIETDISIIQMLLSSKTINFDHFIKFVAKEHQATLPVYPQLLIDNINASGTSQLYTHKYQHFIKFLIIIYQDRCFYMNEYTRTKFYLLQLLTNGHQAHSELDSLLVYLIRDNPYENALSEISVEQPPTQDRAATFRLKDDYWKYFNSYLPTFIMLGSGDESITKYQEYKKSANLRNPDSLPLPAILMNDYYSSPQNSKFFKIIHSDYAHYLITSLLYQYCQSESTTEIPYAINELLFFINLSIRDCNLDQLKGKTFIEDSKKEDKMEIDSKEKFSNTTKIPWEKLNKSERDVCQHDFSIYSILQKYQMNDGKSSSTLQLLVHLLKNSNIKSLYVEKKEYIMNSLESLSNMHPDINNEILSIYPEFKSSFDAVDQTTLEAKKLDAKKRQAEIMAKFAKQQHQFLEENDYSDEDEDVIMTTPNNKDKKGSKSNSPSLSSSPIPLKDRNPTTTTTTTTTSTQQDDSTNVDEESIVCILCLESTHTEKEPLCLIAYSQVTNLLQFSKVNNLKKNYPELMNQSSIQDLRTHHILKTKYKKGSLNFMNSPSSFHTRSCTHYIHHKCYSPYLQKIWDQHIRQDLDGITNSYTPETKEFICPMCRRIANIIIPLPVVQSNNGIQNDINNIPTVVKDSTFNILNWITDLKMKSKTEKEASKQLSQSTSEENIVTIINTTSPTSSSSGKSKFFYKLLEFIIKNSSKLVDSVTPIVLYQILIKNIELLEFVSRPFNQNQYSISTELFNRDMLTIFTLYQSIKNQHVELSTLLKIIKGKSDSVLSIDPLGLFILLISNVLPISTHHHELNNIIQFSLQLFTIQFVLTDFMNSDPQSPSKKIIYPLLSYINNNKTFLSQKLNQALIPFRRSIYITIKSLNRKTSIALTKEDLSNLFTVNDQNNQDNSLYVLLTMNCEKLLDESTSNPMLGKWLGQMESKKVDPFFIVDYIKPTFIDLPNTFEEFVVKHVDVKCKNCKCHELAVDHLAVCLVCGSIVCLASQCCVSPDSSHEGYNHSLTCGTFRVAFYLETRMAKITNIRNLRKCTYNMAYLDQYGEPDAALERGKTLIRNDFHIQELINAWLTHSLEDKFLSTSLLTGKQY